jgi:hypothetical protein
MMQSMPGAAALGGGGAMPAGMPNMQLPGLPPGFTMPGTRSGPPPARSVDRTKTKAKRKAAKAARKKGRKKR